MRGGNAEKFSLYTAQQSSVNKDSHIADSNQSYKCLRCPRCESE